MITFFQEMTNTHWGAYGFQTLFFFSLLLILVLETKRIRKLGTAGYAILILLIVYNPFTYWICSYIFGTKALAPYYCRLFCLVPIVFIITYAIVLVLQKISGWKKLCCMLCMLFIIAISGHSAYGEEWFAKASNFNKVPTDVIQICEIFHENEEPISIMVPTDLTAYMRQMDSKFSMPYGRNQKASISNQLQSEAPDVEAILSYSLCNNTDYIVTLYDENILPQYIAWGCEIVGYTNKYVVLKQHYPQWILTQYADDTGSQAMFYSLENTIDNTLLIIDGGWADNASQVRDVILEKGGTVNAWILTHYHPDHIGAFNVIFQDPQGIKIDCVYTTPYDKELFQSIAQDWDGIDTFNMFVDNIAQSDNIIYVIRDPTIEFSDMKLTIFNCWDQILEHASPGDILNNSSLILKAETPANSILFCGDCHGALMSDLMIKRYGSALQADYVQLGHHGNNSLPVEFYNIVSPKGALFDAPE